VASEAARSLAFQPTEEESEYNPTPHTFTTTQQTPIPSTHPTHFPSPQPGHTAAPTPAATLPTIQVPYNIPTTLHTTHVPPYNPHYLPATHIPLHNFTSTFPTLVHHPIPPIRYHPNNPDVATPSPTSSPTPPFPPYENPSHGTATPVKPTLTNILKSTSPMSPSTRPKTQSFAKPSPPPSRALLWNGSQPFHLTPSITSTLSPICSQPISLAVDHIKPLQSPSWASDKNKVNHSEHSSIVSAKQPFVPRTSTRKWSSNVWHSPYNPAPSPTMSTSTHLPLCTSSSCVRSTMFAWRKCKPFTPNSAMIMPLPPPTPPHNPLAPTPAHASPANPVLPYMLPLL